MHDVVAAVVVKGVVVEAEGGVADEDGAVGEVGVAGEEGEAEEAEEAEADEVEEEEEVDKAGWEGIVNSLLRKVVLRFWFKPMFGA